MNTRRKGNIARLLVIREFERQGYRVSIVERTGRFVKDKDMFGLFDLVALHPVLGYEFIQVATSRPHSHAAFTEFVQRYQIVNQFVTVTQWVRQIGSQFDVYRYTPKDTITTKGITLN